MTAAAPILRDVDHEVSFSRRMQELGHDPELQAFIRHFQDKFGDSVAAIILYGSFLSEVTRKDSSFRDFFVILDSYKATGNAAKRLLHKVVPPDLYHTEVEMPDQGTVDGKFYLLSKKHFERLTHEGAPDIYVMGRLSKRVACVYARDEDARKMVVKGLASATELVMRYAVAYMDEPMDRPSLYKLAMRLSYIAEMRMEDHTRVDQLFQAGEDYYYTVYGKILERLFQEDAVRETRDGRIQRTEKGPGISPLQAKSFIRRSKRRSMYRWPKLVITVDNWMDQMAGKLERTHGIKLQVPEKRSRFSFYTGYRLFKQLRKQGFLK